MNSPLPPHAAFARLRPGTPGARRLVSRLETTVFRAIMDSAVRVAHEQIQQLNDLGHRFEPDEERGPLAFRSIHPDGSVILLDLQLVGSASAGYLTAEEYADRSRQESSPEEERFYRVLGEARELAAARGFAALRPEQRLAFVLGGLEAELQNGGFEQYFLNSAGDHAREAVAALERIGARSAAALLREALKAFAGGPPADRSRRVLMVSELPARARTKWETLATRFYARGEPIAQLAGEYLS